jgi:MFS family permease
MSTAATDTRAESGVLGRSYLLTTIGMCALIAIAAFESLAVTTVMPTVSRELDGRSLYSLAFAAPLASSLVGMVIAGNWADRSGPRVVVVATMVFFGAGLLVVGTAPSMTVFLLGRLLQGLGSGGVIVGLYVMVSRVYPPSLHPSVFAGFAAAWVIPGLVGPVVAGRVTETVGWHWVFLGALLACIPIAAMVAPSLAKLRPGPVDPDAPRVAWDLRRIAWSVGAAAAVVALNLLSELTPVVSGVVIVLAIVLLALALRPLVPHGTFRAASGVPTLVLLRGLVSGAFTAGDVYIPYLFTAQYGFSPAASGVTLTLGAVSWALASWIQGRLGARVSQLVGIRAGVVMVLVGVLAAVATPQLHHHTAVIKVGWSITGFGMGFMYPRFSVLTLRWSNDDERGFNSSALTISEAASNAIVLALTGIALGVLGGAASSGSFVACFSVGAAVALIALVVSRRAVPEGTARA